MTRFKFPLAFVTVVALATVATDQTRTDEQSESGASSNVPVTVENFVRAESDYMLRANMRAFNLEIGQLNHVRKVTTAEEPQTVIRTNQDTIYSGLAVDLAQPATVTLPDVGNRYQSMHVISQDHYMLFEAGAGDYELTEDSVGSRFALVLFRTFVNPNDPEDVKQAHAAQDGIRISGGGSGPFEAPDWDLGQLAAARKALNDIARLGFSTRYAFGTKEETRPIDHLVGAAAGWGGLPSKAALYIFDSVENADGEMPHAVTAKDVPVDAFWSVTVYNADGYLEPNDLGVNNYNSVTAKPNPDGSQTIHFGGCEDGRINCIPIAPGWNYTVRLYSPGDEILTGKWTFPQPVPAR